MKYVTSTLIFLCTLSGFLVQSTSAQSTDPNHTEDLIIENIMGTYQCGNLLLKESDLHLVLKNNQLALEDYLKGRGQRKWSKVNYVMAGLFLGTATGVGFNYLSDPPHRCSQKELFCLNFDFRKEIIITAGIIGLYNLIRGIDRSKKANKNIRKSIDLYNTMVTPLQKKEKSDLSLSNSSNGLGLTYTF